MSNNVSDQAKSIWIPEATKNYDAATAQMKAEILANKGIDNVSKAELMAQLDQGRNTITNTHTSNRDTYGDVQTAIFNQVKQKEKEASGNDPLYVTRRLVQDQQQALEDTPGRNQTILTGNNTPSSGAPTLLTTTPLGGSN